MVKPSSICDILVKKALINEKQVEEILTAVQSSGERIERYVVSHKMVSPSDMTLVLSEYLDIPPISLEHFAPDEELINLIPFQILVRIKVVPVSKVGDNLTLAMADPFDLLAMDEIHMITGLNVIPVVAPEEEIVEVIEKFFVSKEEGMNIEELLSSSDEELKITHEKVESDENQSIDKIIEDTESAPVIKMTSMILVEALRKGASDIHLEPQEKKLVLRYRIDGALVDMPSPPKSLQGAVISRMKLMAGMDIAERRVPQDGRIKIRALGKEVDLRVNTLPTIFGEKICMRILDKSALFPNLAALGLDEEAYKAMKHAISQPHGIILVTGPTGSGKTTTLYSCLLELNRPDVNIITVEDPVEYQLPGINQVQINSYIGFTFAVALRAVLRQAPDIILVGEIRDSETADIAIKAALTGHLVLSTLHTNDAAGAITRLIDMGVEPSLLASSLILAQAQRLLRKLCAACKKPMEKLPVEKLRSFGIDPAIFDGVTVYEATGCPKCNKTGYKGRLAIMEVLRVDKELRRDIVSGLSSKEIVAKAIAKGMLTLKDIGMLKVKAGLTSIDAALSVTGGGE